MHSFLRRTFQTRLSAAFALSLSLAALGACAMPANNGFNQTRPDAMPFAQANTRCWGQAYGAPSGGGSSQYGYAMMRYDNCMAQAGWQRGAAMF